MLLGATSTAHSLRRRNAAARGRGRLRVADADAGTGRRAPRPGRIDLLTVSQIGWTSGVAFNLPRNRELSCESTVAFTPVRAHLSHEVFAPSGQELTALEFNDTALRLTTGAVWRTRNVRVFAHAVAGKESISSLADPQAAPFRSTVRWGRSGARRPSLARGGPNRVPRGRRPRRRSCRDAPRGARLRPISIFHSRPDDAWGPSSAPRRRRLLRDARQPRHRFPRRRIVGRPLSHSRWSVTRSGRSACRPAR